MQQGFGPQCVQPRPTKATTARLASLLPPTLAKSITQHAREARAEESARVRRRLAEDMEKLDQNEREEEGRRLVDEYLDIGSDGNPITYTPTSAGGPKNGGLAVRGKATAFSSSLSAASSSSDIGIPQPRVPTAFDPHCRTLGRISSYPGTSAMRSASSSSSERTTIQHSITASFAGSMIRPLSEGSLPGSAISSLADFGSHDSVQQLGNWLKRRFTEVNSEALAGVKRARNI